MLAARRSVLARRASLALAGVASVPHAVRVPLRRFAAAAPVLSSSPEQFANGTVRSYAEETYNQWLADPKSVHVSWQIYFSSLQGERPSFAAPPSIAPNVKLDGGFIGETNFDAVPSGQVLDHMKVQLLVRAYQVRGHQLAKIDPLEINDRGAESAPELDHKHYGFTDADLDRKFFLGSGILPALAEHNVKSLTLREIKDVLRDIYCGPIGLEYGHILDRSECNWLRSKFEKQVKYKFTKEQKLAVLDRLIWSDSFERFVSTKYPTEKRFGLEGCETLVPGLKAFIDQSVELGVESIAFGMPHRGRLNVLSNVVRKPNESIFCKFSHVSEDTVEGSGDVKYHLGMSYSRPTPSGKVVNLSLAANPSHLEAVNPVVTGKIRAEQFYNKDENRSKAVAVLMHGDAAFAAQGIVYESMGMTNLPAYTTGGVVHVIVNNQIGFTTDPRFARSSPYCSDVAKVVEAPVIHVNGDNVEAVVYSMQLAAEYRAKYHKDVVLDIVCYRKHGHNEIDQPGFTQPLMYQRIQKIKPVLEKYIAQLIGEGTITKEEAESMKQRVWKILEKNYEDSRTYKDNSKEWMSSNWPGFKSPYEISTEILPSYNTGIEEGFARAIGLAAASYPKEFNVHRNLGKILEARKTSVTTGSGIDWATAESIAFGSLLAEGKHVRLSGQDVERGTFSQRHAKLHDQKNESTYIPLNHLVNGKEVPKQSEFTVCNSSLSEFGVLGFELGYSLVSPHQLVCWEAQFGDFANNAQCIIDQFIASGEQKWLQRSGLTMLLPHGYDGQGPEHSSARLERFLQLTDEDPFFFPPADKSHPRSYYRQHQDCNMQVVYPTVPSNYYHLLRRQVQRKFRKPLIVCYSKNILRHPLAKSELAEITGTTQFQRLIPEVLHDKSVLDSVKNYGEQFSNEDPRIPYPLNKPSESFQLLPPQDIRSVVFCSGQVYYNLFKAREANKVNDVVLVRIEELNPFPFHEVRDVLDFYPNATDLVWAQEEAENSGAWTFVEPRLETALRESEWFKKNGAQHAADFAARKVPGGLENAKSTTDRNFVGGDSIRGTTYFRYAGRDPAAAPATGLKTQHIFEEHALAGEALYKGHIPPVEKVESGVPIFKTN